MQVYVEQTKLSLVVYAVLMILVGALFIVDRNLAMDVGFIIAGIFLVIAGLVPMIQMKNVDVLGVIMLVLGILLLVMPNLFTDVVTIILGVIGIIVGALNAVAALKEQNKAVMIVGLLVGVLIIIAGITMLLDMDIAFQIFGALLLIAGVLNLLGAVKN